MARSVDGDIQLSVGIDTSNIEKDLKKSTSAIGKSWASALNVDADKVVDGVNKKINDVGKTVKNVADETTKSEGKFKSLFGSLRRNFSDVANGIFNAGERGRQAFDNISKKADESGSRLSRLGANVVKVLRAFNTPGVDNTNADTAMRGLEDTIDRVESKEEKLGATAEQTGEKIANSSSKASAKEMSLELQIEKATRRVEELRQKQEKIANTPVPTEQYTNLSKKIETAEKTLYSLLNKAEKYEESGKTVPEALKEQIDNADNSLKRLESDMEKLKANGKAFTPGVDTEAYAQTSAKLQEAEAHLEILKQRQMEAASAGGKAARKTAVHWGSAFNKIKGLGSKMVGHIKNLFSKLKGKAKDSAADMDKSFKRGFRNILKYALGIRSFYLLFRKIRAAAKESLKAMATQFPEVNAQLSELKNNFIQLKGSVGTLVQPLLQALAPALNTIINLFTKALTVVGSFFALLTGQKFIYKAERGTSSFADAQDASTAATERNTKALEENQKQLGHYDKLNIIDQDKNKSGSGGGGAGGGAGEMQFVKQPIPDWVADFMKRIKDAWRKADFSEIGEIIGTKIRDALNKINWKKIQRVAEKIGKSLGTLIAGFIKVPGLAKSIGNAIGQALNTVLLGIQSFVKNVPWYKFGKFLADGLSSALLAKDKNGTTLIGNIAKTFVAIVNAAIEAFSGFVKNLKWKEIGKEIAKWLKWAIENIKFEQFMEACGDLVNGIVDLIYELVSDMNTWKKLGEKVAQGINKLFTTINWAKLGKTISDSVMGILTAIESALDTLDWESIGNAVGSFLANIDWFGILTKVVSIIIKTFWGLVKALFTPSGDIKTDIAKAAVAAFLTIFTIKKLAPLGTAIKGIFGSIFGTSIAGAAGSQAVANGATTASSGIASSLGGAFASLKSSLSQTFAFSLKGIMGAVASHPLLIAGVALVGLQIGKQLGNILSEQKWFDDIIEGIFGVEAMTEKEYQEIKARQEAAEKEVTKELEPLTKKVEAANKSTEEALKNIENFNKKLNSINTGKGVDSALKTFEKLSKKTKLTAVETEALKGATKKLIKAYPELNKYVDKSTGVLKINNKELKEVIESSKRQAAAVEAQRKAEELYQQQAPLKKALESAQTAYNEAKTKMNEYRGTFKKTWEDWNKGLVDDATMREVSARMNGYANATNNAYAALSKAKDAQQKNNEAINRANNLIETAKVKSSEWKKVSEELTSKLKSLGASEKEARDITKALKDAVDKGDISWKNYKEIIGKNYKSVGELKTELEKTGKVKVNPKVNVDTKGAVSQVKNLAQYLSNLRPVYNTKVKADMEYSFKVNGQKVTGPISAAQMQYLWSSGQARANAEGGIFTSSGWHDVQGYASGGQVRSGQLFMARENGLPELVGKIRNHTAVMNNGQIVASVANGVYQAVASVANAILPYVRSQTTAMNWLAQNGLQLPDIATGKVLPNNAQFLSTMSTTASDAYKNGVNIDELVQSIKALKNDKEPIIIQMPNGKVLAECVWEEEEKRYKQVRSSTVRPKFA